MEGKEREREGGYHVVQGGVVDPLPALSLSPPSPSHTPLTFLLFPDSAYLFSLSVFNPPRNRKKSRGDLTSGCSLDLGILLEFCWTSLPPQELAWRALASRAHGWRLGMSVRPPQSDRSAPIAATGRVRSLAASTARPAPYGLERASTGCPRHFRAGLSTAVEGVCPRHFYHELRSCRIFREATNFPIGPGGL